MKKPLPDFPLFPHEINNLSPNDPPCAPATGRVWLWRLVGGGYYLLRHVKDAGGDHKVVARRQGRAHAPLLQISPSLHHPNIAKDLRKGPFYRSLYFDRQGHLASEFGSYYACLWITITGWWFWDSGPIQASFQWQGLTRKRPLSHKWRLNTTDIQIEREIGGMLKDPSSDCAFAWNWLSLSAEEQIALVFHVERGTLQECEQILRFVLYTDPLWKEELFWCWNIDLSQVRVGCSIPADREKVVQGSDIEYGQGTLLQNSILKSGNYSSSRQSLELSPRLSRCLQLVLEHFGPHRNREVEKKTLVHQIWNWEGCYWTFPVPIPTHHERLEARLQLRDWMQDKVAPDEIPFLLGDP